MKIAPYLPVNPVLTGIIDSYFLIESEGHVEVQTIPNGRIDAVIILEGEVEWFYPEENCFKVFPACSFYPATRSVGKARTQSHLACISIKFYPHVLSLAAFKNKTLKNLCSFNEIFRTPERDAALINDLRNSDQAQKINLLDAYFTEQFFPVNAVNQVALCVINSLEQNHTETAKVSEVAKQLGISTKTLERRFTKAVGITPKIFSQIRTLQKTVQSIQKANSNPDQRDLIDALGVSYYDQAHFIKSCRQITGFTPKKLFTSLAPNMSDLVVIKEMT